MNEGVLARRIVKALEAEGAFATKTHGGPMQKKGLPDILGCYKGQFFGIEVKVPGRESKVTELQLKRLREIKKAGGIAFITTSVNHARRNVIRGHRI